MANFTAINIDSYKKTHEGATVGGKEKEPQRTSGGPTIESVHEHVGLKLDPVVVAAGVEQRPESIHPDQVAGTPAKAAPETSYFQQPVPLSHAEINHRSKGIHFNIKESLSWLNVFKRAFSRRQKKREELGLAA